MLVARVARGDLEMAVLGLVELAQVLVGVGGRRLAGVRPVLVHEHAGEEARLVGELAERRDLALDHARIGGDLVEVDDLVEVRDERVGQDDHRRARLLGRVEGVDRDAEGLLDAVGVEGDAACSRRCCPT